jgi:hypothetical protein
MAVGIFAEEGVGSGMCCGCFSFLFQVSDLPLCDGIVNRADLKQAISPMESQMW